MEMRSEISELKYWALKFQSPKMRSEISEPKMRSETSKPKMRSKISEP